MEEIIPKKEIEECLIPPPGDCWRSARLMDYNCEECIYFDGCTHEKKGKWDITRKKTNKKR